MNTRLTRLAAAALAATTIAGTAAVMAAPAQAATGKYTAAQVAKHKSSSNCWTSINGSVYNLTSWIARHPGGSGPILSVCGRDGSAAFNGQHRGNGGVSAMLGSFKVGTLKK